MERQPKGLTFTRSYHPDKERMVRALQVLLESEPVNTSKGKVMNKHNQYAMPLS